MKWNKKQENMERCKTCKCATVCIDGECYECYQERIAYEAQIEAEHGDWGDRK